MIKKGDPERIRPAGPGIFPEAGGYDRRKHQQFSFYNRATGEAARPVLKSEPLNMTPEESKGYYSCRSREGKTGANRIRIAGGKKRCLDRYESYDRFRV